MSLPVAVMEAAFPPALARFGRTLCPMRADAVSCAELFAPPALQAAAAAHATTYAPGGADARAALSFWSQHYLLALVPAAVAAALAAAHDLPVAAEGMAVVLAPTGLPEWLCLPGGGGATTVDCPVARLTPLLRGHLEPLADGLARAGLPPRVFWSNTGHVLGWALRVVDAPGCGQVRDAMAAAAWVDGGGNPIASALAENGCSRRVCCLRYRLPGIAACGSCPRPAAVKAPPPAPPRPAPPPAHA